MNVQGFRTRNKHRTSYGKPAEPRLFTTASVRGILHNPFYAGKIRYRDQILQGVHEFLVSDELFQAVQIAMKRNSGRSETLHPRPIREYLLKGLIHCAHCLRPMWAQTNKNGHRYYREQKGSRGSGYCMYRSASISCHVPEEQMGRIVGAIVLTDAWTDRALARIHLADGVDRIPQERKKTKQRLKRLGEVYLDGFRTRDDYLREKKMLEDKLADLVGPGVDAAREAGKLLQDLPTLWEEANLAERGTILTSTLDAVYLDAVEEKALVAIRPKPAFRRLFEVAAACEGSDVILINEPPPTGNPEAAHTWFWWRR